MAIFLQNDSFQEAMGFYISKKKIIIAILHHRTTEGTK